MTSPPPLDTLLKSRATLIELVLAAIGLALGVNLLASSIATYFATSNVVVALFGVLFTLLSLVVIARRTLAARRMEKSVEAFLCFQRDGPDLIPVPRYRYSEEVDDCLKALFSENEAPKKLWQSDPVHGTLEAHPDAKVGRSRTTAAGKLLVEATEYVVLEILSTHLTDYFNQSALDSERLRELTREDLGPIVFGNRFLDTFSRPMKERAAFVDQNFGDDSNAEHVVAAYGNGVMFSRFDLVLPAGAKVTRTGEGKISIDAPKFCMTVHIGFEGFGSVLPRGFYELYLGDYEYMDVRAYRIDVTASIDFKRLSLLSRSGWEYHQWLDSFLARLEKDFSRKAFLQRIAWESAVTTARVVERSVAKRSQSSSIKKDNTSDV